MLEFLEVVSELFTLVEIRETVLKSNTQDIRLAVLNFYISNSGVILFEMTKKVESSHFHSFPSRDANDVICVFHFVRHSLSLDLSLITYCIMNINLKLIKCLLCVGRRDCSCFPCKLDHHQPVHFAD